MPLGETRVLMYQATIVPGAYDVYCVTSDGGLVAPRNTKARLRCYDITP